MEVPETMPMNEITIVVSVVNPETLLWTTGWSYRRLSPPWTFLFFLVPLNQNDVCVFSFPFRLYLSICLFVPLFSEAYRDGTISVLYLVRKMCCREINNLCALDLPELTRSNVYLALG